MKSGRENHRATSAIKLTICADSHARNRSEEGLYIVIIQYLILIFPGSHALRKGNEACTNKFPISQ
jgi:hypothetical protein